MRASFRRAHVVHEGMERLPIAAVPLKRHFARVRAGGRAAVRYLRGLHLETDDRGMDRVLVVVQVRHELGDATLVVKVGAPAVALIHQLDLDAAHEKRQFPHPVRDLVEIELGGLFENGRIGKKVNESSGVLRGSLASRLERPGSFSAAIGLLVDRPVPADLHPKPGGERVHDRNAHAVQAGGVLVGVGVELAARMQAGSSPPRPPEARCWARDRPECRGRRRVPTGCRPGGWSPGCGRSDPPWLRRCCCPSPP